jgi:apolipoprotein N-acyltransferase
MGIFLILLIFTIVYGAYSLRKPAPGSKNERPFTALLVQTDGIWSDNVEGGVKWERQALANAEKLTLDGLKKAPRTPDLVVWCENILPYRADDEVYEKVPGPAEGGVPLAQFFRSLPCPLLAGAPSPALYKGVSGRANTAVLLDRGKIIGLYQKRQLIPFAECLPGIQHKWVRDLAAKLAPGLDFWLPGTEVKTLEVPLQGGGSVAIGTPVCFEDSFAGICSSFFGKKAKPAKAKILVNITNDYWSKRASAEYQQMAAARFRAIENRAPLIRCTNSGITCLVDSLGRIGPELPPFKEGSLWVETAVK